MCPNRDWFFGFEKLDGCSVVMEEIGTILIKIFDWMVRELKKVRYVPQMKRNLISVGDLKTLGFGLSITDGVLKMTRASMVVLKGIRRNNLY